MKSIITTYNKNTCLRDSFYTALKNTVSDINKNRWLIWVNFKKDFFSKYNQSGLGKVWALILPIVPVSAYIFLGYMRVISVRGEIPYTVYIVSGMTFWFLLSGGIRAGMTSFQRDKVLLTKMDIPLIVVVLSRYGEVCADTLIRLIFLTIVILFYNIKIGAWFFFIPLIVLPIGLLSFGVGVILGVFNVVNTDTENSINLLLTYGMWFCSVIFPMPDEGLLGAVNSVNIFNHLIVGTREFIIYGHFNNPTIFFSASIISILLFLIAIKWQYSFQYKIKGLL